MLGPVQGQAQLPLKSCAPDRRIGRGLPFCTTDGRPIMNDSAYAAFAALDRFFDVVQKGLEGLVDGQHFFDTVADEAIF